LSDVERPPLLACVRGEPIELYSLCLPEVKHAERFLLKKRNNSLERYLLQCICSRVSWQKALAGWAGGLEKSRMRRKIEKKKLMDLSDELWTEVVR
jgi:hypothetical protein